MTNKEYENEIISETGIKIEQIFDFSLSPYLEELSKVFEFYRKTLDINSLRYNLKKSYIFYLNDKSVNAKAGISDKYNIICINSGLIIFLIQNIFEKEELDKNLKFDYKEIYNFLDNPIHILMYQVALHFTFYHELGHLVQKSEILKSFICERPTGINDFDLKMHKLEFDADSFSATSIGAHIHQYAFKIFGEKLNSYQVESVIEIFCTSILLYFLSFESYKEKIYYEESTHPHPIIRILNVILTITNYCQNSPKLKEKGIYINHNKIYDLTIYNTMKIESQILKSKKAKNFSQILSNQRTEILAYYEKLLVYKPRGFTTAMDKWNETITFNYHD
jgi:hypothetical protein